MAGNCRDWTIGFLLPRRHFNDASWWGISDANAEQNGEATNFAAHKYKKVFYLSNTYRLE
jgi:hypothetical protein